MQDSILEERQQKIVQMVLATGKVYVNELAEKFKVTPETIRRDLNRLENRKLLKKVYGGALSYDYDHNLQSRLNFEHNFQQRLEFAKQEKCRIANTAVQLISAGDTLFIDFGSTTLEFAKALVNVDELTVICNSPLLAEVLQANSSIEVILTGGTCHNHKFECLGAVTLDTISRFFADYAIIGAGAIHWQAGIMDQDLEEASVAKKMIRHSRKNIVLADASKFGQYASVCVMNWREIDNIVTDDGVDIMQHIDPSQRGKIITARSD